jgi:short-subunit dehydrogenase
MTSHFTNHVVLLTGASKGIGEQLAYQLARQGAHLVLAARGADRLNSVAQECERLGGQTLAVPTDVTDETQCQHLIEKAVEQFGRMDMLLFNAGYGYPGRFEASPDLGNLKREIALNYLGLVHCVYYALPHLKQSKGRIVSVSSFGALVGLPGTIGYNASKHAARGFLNTLRAELAGTGVTVTIVYPGAVRTERLEETMGANVNHVPTMSPERCTELTLDAAAKRKRQVIMTFEGKLLFWLSLLIPGLLDRQLGRLTKLYER